MAYIFNNVDRLKIIVTIKFEVRKSGSISISLLCILVVLIVMNDYVCDGFAIAEENLVDDLSVRVLFESINPIDDNSVSVRKGFPRNRVLKQYSRYERVKLYCFSDYVKLQLS